MADLQSRLRELREEKGLSKWEVGNAINSNASPHTLRKYETVGVNSKINNIIELAKFFNVTTDYLLGVSNTRTVDLSKVLNEDLLEELKNRMVKE
ncbi:MULTISPECIES: helix-turn-helix domain-containing protein [Bacillus cereus group]|uniref:Helix-turn-helix transcriptional regulator n=1 Tax=Bacillus thuringiensis TaxID=1428 RepID=A0AAW9JE87_BACTU|nr:MULTISPECIES: helix-turn-helix transcriptional regulator [Bacillus cereus group]EXY08970.1 XRE family transcriptional regulator [Bacillus thuringiensis]MDZ5475097.1 helix-turn-helix transcriptional regulator [Bacillus thuringiensis]MEB8633023.1 helix-turn-helix transcriptional regulator [Bacillus cereus]MEB8741794.1 helix-turn-helix transcriptional regulator [Bacillus cereus]MEB8796411.1 helix-turn-helix transcriptional regulator [Bacillus cereus]